MSTLRAQIGRFAAVGVASTCLHLGLFAALHLAWSSQSANLIALTAATGVSTVVRFLAMRSWIFAPQGERGQATTGARAESGGGGI